ncbi:MAG: (R)-hydratase [Cycloclasticus sp. symbiont of Poecilosclerida sp. M]|nr:MAG: (R)-hydratase [Cycloclasticus sp. symbiont of Poecilosclerida sp. M]
MAEGFSIEEMEVGQTASMSKTVSEADIDAFAAVTGDCSPIHVSADYAANSMFKQKIAHGMLSAGFISATIGTQLPGPGSVYLKQTLTFKGPVMIGDTVKTTATITSIKEKRKMLTIETICTVDGKPVVVGEAWVMKP